MSEDLKSLLEEQGKTFAEFKAANDQLQAEVKKLGGADVVQNEKVDRISAALDKIGDELKAAQKRADDIEAKFNRGALTGGKATATEVKAAAEFARIVGEDVTVDDYRGYKAALYGEAGYLRKGDATKPNELKALSVGSDPDGGYLVEPDTSGRIATRLFETSPIRQYATVLSIGTDAMEGLIDNGEAGAGWVGEKASRPETSTPQLGKWSIPVNELYAMPMATAKVLEDSRLDLEGWLAGKVADKFGRVENAAFIAGDGNLKPKGFLAYDKAATADASRAWGTFQYVVTGQSGAFASSNPADKLLDLVYEMKPAYRTNAVWIGARRTFGAIRKLKDGQGNYLWQPSIVPGQPATVLGFAMVEAEDMPAIAADSFSLGFGDLRETYTILDRVGISVLRDPYTTKGFVGFYTRKRVGGGAVNFDSFKLLKFGTS